ncbi:NB-ARC domains-containing protein [Tanacetum coccineum]
MVETRANPDASYLFAVSECSQGSGNQQEDRIYGVCVLDVSTSKIIIGHVYFVQEVKISGKVSWIICSRTSSKTEFMLLEMIENCLKEMSPHLYKAIEESRFLIVIFSKNYASSSWCLRELVKILECKEMGKAKHEVQIIFYDLKPDVARKQKRSYEEALCRHEISNSTEVDKWKEALSMAANLSGWDLEDMTNG